MSDVITPNLALTKPEPGTSENTWGDKLNANFDKLDTFASAYLRSVSALALEADRLVYATGAGTAAATPLTAFARTLLDDTSALQARATLGLGTLATLNTATHANIDISGAPLQSADAAHTQPRLYFVNSGDNATFGRIGDSTLRALFNLAGSGTSISAGSGLTGGGTLAADRTISLGTPSSITSTSTNSTTGTSHTHAISEATIRTLIAEGAAGQVGTHAFLRNNTTALMGSGIVYAGSDLTYSDTADSSGGSVSGSWRCMGRAPAGRSSLFLRVS